MHRLVPHLFFPVDCPQHDPIISVAKDESDALLFPILHELAMEPPPLVQGLVRPYHFDILQEVNPNIESSLSRIVQMLMHQLLVSQSKYMTVSTIFASSGRRAEYRNTPSSVQLSNAVFISA